MASCSTTYAGTTQMDRLRRLRWRRRSSVRRAPSVTAWDGLPPGSKSGRPTIVRVGSASHDWQLCADAGTLAGTRASSGHRSSLHVVARAETHAEGDLGQLLVVDEVASLLRISRSGLYRLMREGELVPVKLGHRTLFEPREVERFIASCKTPMTSARTPSDRSRQ